MEDEEYNQFENYEKQMDDIDPESIVNFRINPDYLIFKALMNAQNILAQVGLTFNDRIHNYWVMIEHVETLVDGAGKLPKDYKEKVDKYMEEIHYHDQENVSVKQIAMMCNYKMKLLTKMLFHAQPITDPIVM